MTRVVATYECADCETDESMIASGDRRLVCPTCGARATAWVGPNDRPPAGPETAESGVSSGGYGDTEEEPITLTEVSEYEQQHEETTDTIGWSDTLS